MNERTAPGAGAGLPIPAAVNLAPFGKLRVCDLFVEPHMRVTLRACEFIENLPADDHSVSHIPRALKPLMSFPRVAAARGIPVPE